MTSDPLCDDCRRSTAACAKHSTVVYPGLHRHAEGPRMTDERLAAIEASHRPGVTVNRIGPDFGKRPCQDCRRAWPCDTAIVLARLREVEQENERLERELRRCEEGHLA